MQVETAEAFARRVSTVMRERDRAGYKALFDLPCMVWGDGGPDLRLTEARLDETFDAVERVGESLGMVDHIARIENVMGLGDTLTVMRVLTSLRLKDGSETDPAREMWILRERDGRLRVQALVNTMSASLLSDEDRPCATFDAPPEGAGPTSGAEFVQRLNRAYEARDVDANIALMALPYFRIGDAGNGLVTTPEGRRRAALAYHETARSRAGAERMEFLAERPMGASYIVMRVRAHGETAEDGPYDSAQELWILHERNGALRLVGAVNPPQAGFVTNHDFTDAGADA